MGETATMAFGQPSGPPAQHRQVRELLELLQQAGHADFRDARGPMGFTQRQAAGKFTHDEAEAFIERLQEAGPPPGGDTGHRGGAVHSEPETAARPPRLSDVERGLRRIPTERLAGELRRRGWTVTEPDSGPS